MTPPPRRVQVETDVLVEIARDEDLLDAVAAAVEDGRLVVVATAEQQEELEVARGDMACGALAGLESLPTTAATAERLAATPITLVTDEPDGSATGPTGSPVIVWSLEDLRRHLAEGG